MGDGSWDKALLDLLLISKFFTLSETRIMQEIFLEKFNISSYLTRGKHYDPNRGYIIKLLKRGLD